MQTYFGKRNTMDITKTIADQLTEAKELPAFKAGDNITVYYTIKEGSKQRTQFFKGDVIQRKGSGATETFTMSFDDGTSAYQN